MTIELEFQNCPLCEARESRPNLTTRDYFYGVPGEFRIVGCLNCNHHYMDPSPTTRSIPDCYPKSYAQYAPPADAPQAVPERPWYARRPIRWIPGLRSLYKILMDTRSVFIPDSPTEEKRALEIGCGIGAFLNQLTQEGWKPYGIELSPEAAEIARKGGHEVVSEMIDESSFNEQSFDAVFAWMVIEHLRNPNGTFRDIFSWLKEGGAFCFSVPNFGSFQKQVFGKYWQCYDLPRHLQHFTTSTIVKTLQEIGFEKPVIIHQRNVRSWYASLGARLLDRNPQSHLGQKLLRWFDDPPFILQVALSPLGFVIALIRQSERITIVARKPGPR